MYRTGDRGRFLPDGRLQHLGRYDDQLKIRGFRIEPGEIESTLCEHPGVNACAVVVNEAPNGEKQLVAYIVDEPGCPSEAGVRDWLRRRLPEHMIPSSFTHHRRAADDGKRKAQQGGIARAHAAAEARHAVTQAPRDDTERRVAGLWVELLAAPVTDVNADFFDIGGHSLLAARLIFKVQREFGAAPSLAAFLDSGRTVAGLAALINNENGAHGRHRVRFAAALRLRRPGIGGERAALQRPVGRRSGGTRPDPRPTGRAVRSVSYRRTACQPGPFGDLRAAA